MRKLQRGCACTKDRARLRRLALTIFLLAPGSVWGEAESSSYGKAGSSGGGGTPGYYLTPSLSLAEVYDDNLFSVASRPATTTTGPSPGTTVRGREDDLISRATPGAGVGYRSAPFTLLGDYSMDAEVYADHSELDRAPAQQSALLSSNYSPDELLSFDVNGGYRETQTPRVFNSLLTSPQQQPPDPTLGTGLETLRAHAQQYSAASSVHYSLTPLTGLAGGYAFGLSDQVGAAMNRTHTADATLDHTLTQLDQVSLKYDFQYFETEPVSSQTTSPPPPPPAGTRRNNNVRRFHVIQVGWTRQLTELATLELRGGPRFEQGRNNVDADADAKLTRQLESGLVSIGYQRTQSTAVGQNGTFTTDRATAELDYQPLEFCSLNLAFGYSRNRGSAFDADVYSTQLSASYELTSWLSLSASHQFRYQDRAINVQSGTAALGQGREIYHNIVQVGLSTAYPFRLF